jgi:tetratricopeptide (TPR) repeat protein
MKRIIYSLVVIIGFASLSCSKAIEENPQGFLNDKTLFETEAGVQAVLTGCYERTASYYYFGLGYVQYVSLASGAFWTNNTATLPIAKMTAQATDAAANTTWREAYASINAVNGLIDGMSSSPVKESVKKQVLGEGHFLRAVLYFNNVRLWGAVPLRLHITTSEDLYMARTPADKIYEQVISDLQKAKDNLPAPGSVATGRPNKWAAYALLAKVYMTLAGNDQASPYWQKAYDEAIQVYNSNAYSLVRPFKDLYDVTKENSKESIFEIQFSMSGGPANGLTQTWMPSNSTYTPKQSTSPLARVRAHKATFDDFRNTYPGDPRVNATFIYNSLQTNAGVTIQVYPSTTAASTNGYPYVLKYADPNYISAVSNSNFIYFRYADVLLMLAEIENELQGPGGAYQYINLVLTRARDANGNGTIETTEVAPANWSGMSQDVFRQRIMLERRIELLSEGHEFFDTRRRGEAYLSAYLQSHNSHPKFNATNDFLFPTDAASVKRLLLMPIPSDELNSNRLITVADQNFGY